MLGLVVPTPAAGAAPAGDPAPSTTVEKKVKAKKEEESDDDMAFGLSDKTSSVTCSIKSQTLNNQSTNQPINQSM